MLLLQYVIFETNFTTASYAVFVLVNNVVMTQAYPQEIVYIVDGEYDPEKAQMCYRDKDIKNRYWFEFPAEWRTSTRKSRVIGFRGLHIEKVSRNLNFNIHATLTRKETADPELPEKYEYVIELGNFIIYPNQSLENIGEIFKEVWKTNVIEYTPIWESEGKPVFTENSFYMSNITIDSGTAVFLVGVSPDINYRISFYVTPSTRAGEYEDFAKIFPDWRIQNSIAAAKLVTFRMLPSLHFVTLYTDWNRDKIILASNLSNNNSRNYLGNEGKDYNPVKYYEVQCEETRFYIDMFQSNNQNNPAMLIDDFRDKIVLEMIIPPE